MIGAEITVKGGNASGTHLENKQAPIGLQLTMGIGLMIQHADVDLRST